MRANYHDLVKAGFVLLKTAELCQKVPIADMNTTRNNLTVPFRIELLKKLKLIFLITELN